jgi:hypothetical protein
VILATDDLGSAAVGRWLREVSIAAGSSVLTVPAVAGVGPAGRAGRLGAVLTFGLSVIWTRACRERLFEGPRVQIH